MSRTPVLALLGGFTGAVLLVGLVVQRRHRLELAAWTALGLAVVTGGTLALLGMKAQRAVPLTMSSAELAAVLPDGQVHSVGELAVYSPVQQSSGLAGDADVHVWPAPAEGDGQLVRLVAEDHGAWRYDGLDLPAGAMLTGAYTRWQRPSALPRATAQFGPAGLTGRLTGGAWGRLSDVLLVGPGGRAALALGPTGQFVAGDVAALPDGQFVAGSLVTDSQRAHQAVARQVLTRRGGAASPLVLGWAQSNVPPVRLAASAHVTTETLLGVPLEIARSAPGSIVHVPAYWVALDLAPGGQPVYNSVEGTWIPDIAQPRQAYFALALPRQVQPLTATRVHVMLAVRAPGWRVTLLGGTPAAPQAIAQRASPDGTYTFDLAGRQLPATDDQGRLLLGLRVDSGGSATYQIERLAVAVDGQVGAAAPEAPDAAGLHTEGRRPTPRRNDEDRYARR
jgi:hypothetical protein